MEDKDYPLEGRRTLVVKMGEGCSLRPNLNRRGWTESCDRQRTENNS